MLSVLTTIKTNFFLENADNTSRCKLNKSEQRKIKVESEMRPKRKLVSQNM